MVDHFDLIKDVCLVLYLIHLADHQSHSEVVIIVKVVRSFFPTIKVNPK